MPSVLRHGRGPIENAGSAAGRHRLAGLYGNAALQGRDVAPTIAVTVLRSSPETSAS